MKVRKLDTAEHGRTRKLWTDVFSEDSKAFLDYYYFLKARDNEIYVLEEDEEIRSMLHLNPYRMAVCKEEFSSHYIVGVATEETYRGRGYMRKLLVESLGEMYRRKEWFTFLMPAAEAIYTPYDFRFVYAQRQEVLPVAEAGKASAVIRDVPETGTPGAASDMGTMRLDADAGISDMDATLSDAAEMAAFFSEHFAGRWQVYAVRDESYYQRQIFEQQSEGGGIRLMREQGRLVGMFLYSREDELEVLEPLYLPEYKSAFQAAVRKLACENQDVIRIYASEMSDEKGAERKPTIMARLLHPEGVLAAMHVKAGCEMDCSFAVLDSILVQNSRIWRICSKEEDAGKVRVRETEDSQGVLTIAALTSLLFGMKSVEEVAMEEGVFLSAYLQEELQKLEPLGKVYLNELV